MLAFAAAKYRCNYRPHKTGVLADFLIATATVLRFVSLLKNLLASAKWLHAVFLGKPKNLRDYGSWAIINGPTDGIGKALAFDLASEGLNLVLAGQNPSKLEATLSELRELYGTTIEVKIVITDFATLTREEIAVGIPGDGRARRWVAHEQCKDGLSVHEVLSRGGLRVDGEHVKSEFERSGVGHKGSDRRNVEEEEEEERSDLEYRIWFEFVRVFVSSSDRGLRLSSQLPDSAGQVVTPLQLRRGSTRGFHVILMRE